MTLQVFHRVKAGEKLRRLNFIGVYDYPSCETLKYLKIFRTFKELNPKPAVTRIF